MQMSATEIHRQSVRIKEQVNKFNNYAEQMSLDIDDIAYRIDKEDSDLHGKINTLKEIFEIFKNELSASYTELADGMETYAERTIQNEKEAEGNVGERIGDLNSILDELKAK